MSLAVVIIASEKRRETTFPICLGSVLANRPDEVIVVADFPVLAKDVRSFLVPPMTRTTCDALVKRDVGWIASTANNICYLCDDHALIGGFVDRFRKYEKDDWGILVPQRFCHPAENLETVWLPVGQDHDYAAGHCAIYRRHWGHLLPWATTAHHPNWDVIHTRQLQKLGATLKFADHDLCIRDLEPENQPWSMTDEQRRRHEAFHDSMGVWCE